MQEVFVASWWRVQEIMNFDHSKREAGWTLLKSNQRGGGFNHNDAETLGSAAWKSYTVSVIWDLKLQFGQLLSGMREV